MCGRRVVQKVLRGKFAVDEAGKLAREASARLFPKLEYLKKAKTVEGAAELWKHLGAPGKGALIGLAAMLPFIPGPFILSDHNSLARGREVDTAQPG